MDGAAGPPKRANARKFHSRARLPCLLLRQVFTEDKII